MLVFVINKQGQALMPCSTRTARLILKKGKAKIVSYNPFTIQLIYGSTGYVQETNIGVDVGSKHIGIAITSQNNILAKGQIDLRQNISQLLETRKILRRFRRGRKTRYRQARFLNRRKGRGWLPPSIRTNIKHTIKWINKFYNLLPKCNLILEVGKFDIQKIENPEIQGIQYQQGNLYNYRNRIAYLIERENNNCQLCKKGYIKGNSWRLHHIWGKEKDRSKDWALLHESCHKELHSKNLEHILQKQKSTSFKGSTFMNIIRVKLLDMFPKAKFTYGNITFQDRCDLNLPKTHYNDAIAISGIKQIHTNNNIIFILKHLRKKKRSLHEISCRKKKQKNISCIRNKKNTKILKGIYLNDCVNVLGKKGFVSGFAGNGGCYVRDVFNNYITTSENYNKIIPYKLLKTMCHNNNWGLITHLKEEEYYKQQFVA
jgi:hypothetical protein